MPPYLGTVTNEHLHQLRARKLQKHGVSLPRTRTCEQRLARAWWTVQQHALGRLNADGLEPRRMRHGPHDRCYQLLHTHTHALATTTTNTTSRNAVRRQQSRRQRCLDNPRAT